MSNKTIPPTTRVRPSRAHNIDTDRLLARQAFISDLCVNGFRDCARRREFVNFSREMFAIENVLDSRGVLYIRRTLTKEQSDALSNYYI